MTEEFFISMLLGGIFGLQLFKVVFVRSPEDDLPIMKKMVGVIAGGFLGFCAGKLLILGIPQLQVFPRDYFVLTILVMLFCTGFQKFIRDGVDDLLW